MKSMISVLVVQAQPQTLDGLPRNCKHLHECFLMVVHGDFNGAVAKADHLFPDQVAGSHLHALALAEVLNHALVV